MSTAFDKIEGLGNDFVVISAEALGQAGATPVEICDRHRGVGADGVLYVDAAARSMRVVNADGSRPEMCGNGIRCVVLWLAERGHVRVGETVAIDTDAGPHACTLLAHEPERARVEVAMRPYAIEPDPQLIATTVPWIERAIEVSGHRVVGTFVSMGNPHVVVFDAEKQGAAAIAEPLERHPLFPSRVNVGLAEQTGPRSLSLRVFERGVGYTQACGTGACAAAAAAVETGRIARGESIDVRLPGGVLTIVVGVRGTPVRMTGPARRVFTGRLA